MSSNHYAVTFDDKFMTDGTLENTKVFITAVTDWVNIDKSISNQTRGEASM
jgi:hypothetical protein